MGKLKETLIDTPAAKPVTTPVAKPTSTAVSTGDANPFTQYGESISANDFVGDLLLFKKGDYVAGKEGREIPHGTLLVANMNSLEIGWQKWEDGHPAGHRMGLLVNGFKPVRRTELGDLNSSAWDTDDDGKPKDPWQFTNALVLADAETGALFTFTTSSKGGLDAIGLLSKAYGREMRARPDEWPVVEIGADSYLHPKTSIGRVKFPVLKIVGWALKDEGETAPATPTTPDTPPAGGGKAATSASF